jgi:hypothetical protein
MPDDMEDNPPVNAEKPAENDTFVVQFEPL